MDSAVAEHHHESHDTNDSHGGEIWFISDYQMWMNTMRYNAQNNIATSVSDANNVSAIVFDNELDGSPNISSDAIHLFPFKNLVFIRLSHIDLSNHIIRILDELPHTLESLRLDFNSILTSGLPDTFSKFMNLTTLTVSNNSLTFIPPSIWGLTGLTVLDFSNNNLHEFPSDMQQLTELEHVSLSHNQLSTFPITLPSLLTLDISHNSYEDVPESIRHMNNLGELNISHNRISALPEFLSESGNLYVIECDGNNISRSNIPQILLQTITISCEEDDAESAVINYAAESPDPYNVSSEPALISHSPPHSPPHSSVHYGNDRYRVSRGPLTLADLEVADHGDSGDDDSTTQYTESESDHSIGAHHNGILIDAIDDDSSSASTIYSDNSSDTSSDADIVDYGEDGDTILPINTQETDISNATIGMPDIPNTIYDPITMEDISPANFLTDNIAIYMDNNWVLISRTKIVEMLFETPNSNIVYKCNAPGVDYWDGDAIDTHNPLFRVAMIDGISEHAFVYQTQLNRLIQQRHQHYRFVRTNIQIPSVVSRSVYLGHDADLLGASHCQMGRGGIVYNIEVFDVSNSQPHQINTPSHSTPSHSIGGGGRNKIQTNNRSHRAPKPTLRHHYTRRLHPIMRNHHTRSHRRRKYHN